MITTETKNNVVENIQLTMEERKAEQLADLDLVKFMSENDADLVKKAVEKIQANVIASIPEGIPVPGTTLYVTASGSGNEITVINITLNSKIKADKKFKYAKSFVGDGVVTAIADFFTEAYTELVIDIMAEDNLEKVNEVLAEAAKLAGLGYKVTIVSAIGGTNAKVAYIADDEVTFYADQDKVFEVDDILALQEPSEFITEEVIAGAKKQVAESLEEAQTPEQLVAAHGGLFISTIAAINKNMKPITMIKQVCNKNAENINTDKDLIAYYLKDNVYALVAQRDGQFEVLLSPFDTETFRKVDVDVLKELGK